MKKVECDIKIYDNIIELTPLEGIKDNHVYEIKVKKVRSADKQKVIDDLALTVCTKMTPAYCSLEALNSVVESIELPEDKSLYYIRDASRLAEYITKKSYEMDSIPFEVSQFTKYKAAHDSLLKYYVERSSEAGTKGTIGEVNFENSANLDFLKDLLDYLRGQAREWEEHLKGNGFEGRAAPKGAVRGLKRYPGKTPYSTHVHSLGRGRW